MAIADVGALGTVGNPSGAAGTTLVMSLDANAEVGRLVAVRVICDNTATTIGDHDEISSLSDTQSNVYVKCAEWTQAGGSAADGCTVSLWISRITTQLTSGVDTITINFANSVAERAASARKFTVDANVQVAGVTQDNLSGNGYGSLTLSGLPSKEYLFLMAGAKENNSVTNPTPTTNFTILLSFRSRNNAAAVRGAGEFWITTATGATSNPTHNITTDTAAVFVAIEEVAAPPATSEPNRMMMGIGV